MQLQAIEDRRQRTIDLLQKMRLDQPDFDFDELDQVSTSIKLFPLFPVKWCYVLWSERHLIDKQTCQPIDCWPNVIRPLVGKTFGRQTFGRPAYLSTNWLLTKCDTSFVRKTFGWQTFGRPAYLSNNWLLTKCDTSFGGKDIWPTDIWSSCILVNQLTIDQMWYVLWSERHLADRHLVNLHTCQTIDSWPNVTRPLVRKTFGWQTFGQQANLSTNWLLTKCDTLFGHKDILLTGIWSTCILVKQLTIDQMFYVH